MPRVYRAMLPDGDKPAVGSDARSLGVRVPADIVPDTDGKVHPATGGMSVSPRLAELPPHRIPRRLRLLPGLASAVGSNSVRVWRMGEGPFVGSSLSALLMLRVDSADSRHGLVEPDAIMPLMDYTRALAATRPDWAIDEANP